jgi:hypothetical protein
MFVTWCPRRQIVIDGFSIAVTMSVGANSIDQNFGSERSSSSIACWT